MEKTELTTSKIRRLKATSRSDISTTYLKITFTIFTLIISIKPYLFQNNSLLSIQIVAAIPLLLSSLFARTHLIYTERKVKTWERYGTLCFLLAYALLINSVGILLSMYSNPTITIVFFLLNIVLDVSYSILEVIENREKLRNRLWKDGLFIFLTILFGLLPALHIY